MHERVIKGGRVALPTGWGQCDIGIDDGRISAIGADLDGASTTDASGLWVMPGGIDAHCHLDQPSWGGAETADGFSSGSISAAFGGTSCIIPFAMPGPNMSTFAAVERSLECANGQSILDYGLHGVMTPASGEPDEELRALAAAGIPSVKAFMTYDGFAVSDELMLAMMDCGRSLGMTVMVHAENDAIIRRTTLKLLQAGKTGFPYHAVAHGEAAEREATHRVATLAEVSGSRVVIVHVSTAQSLDEVTRSQARGTDVVAETCPQYLLLDASYLAGKPEDAARFVFSPPPRSVRSQNALWDGLTAGTISLWSSDHSPYRLADKLPEGRDVRFDRAVSGIPGIETRLPILFSEGLLTNRLSLERYLAVAGGNAAAIYGLDHLKGRISVGLDADLALWDPTVTWTLRSAELHSGVDFTPYEGRSLTGKPVTVLVRGTPVIEDGKLLPGLPRGQFIKRRAANPSTFKYPIEETTPWLDI
ncbi:dihydropyrimidinase [Neorhizobium sp. NCHU2750]|uniref:dihydropyrimidinase n=1 Tax=Neorhizobium sp. NCHU2750 TaxID=1825976 RepID=UPI000E7402D1|nr:dihydropyrimidinase [Neorhizobium sp. NCHU2750]